MTDKAVSALTSLTGANTATGDLLYIVDISEASAADRSKKITIQELFDSVPAGAEATPAIAAQGDQNTGIYFPAADTVAISTGGSARARIDSSGNVSGANTTGMFRLANSARSALLPTYAFVNSADVGMYNPADNTLGFVTVQIERARITSGGYFKASNDGNYAEVTECHELRTTENARAVIITSTNASYTSDLMQIRAARNTTDNTFFVLAYYNTGAAAYKFRVADSGNVANTNNSYGAISDEKLKQDIVDAGSQWDDIKGLRVRKFHYKADPTGPLQIGLIAQEAQTVSPGLIEEHPDYEEVEVQSVDADGNPVVDADGNPVMERQRNPLGTSTKAVKYSVLYMKAVKALQEAITRIEQLEAKVTALEAR
jgi:hypothetical protein